LGIVGKGGRGWKEGREGVGTDWKGKERMGRGERVRERRERKGREGKEKEKEGSTRIFVHGPEFLVTPLITIFVSRCKINNNNRRR